MCAKYINTYTQAHIFCIVKKRNIQNKYERKKKKENVVKRLICSCYNIFRLFYPSSTHSSLVAIFHFSLSHTLPDSPSHPSSIIEKDAQRMIYAKINKVKNSLSRSLLKSPRNYAKQKAKKSDTF